MYRVLFLGKDPFYLDNLNLSVTAFSEIDEALKRINEYNPQLIVLSEQIKEEDLFNFCQKIREKYSFVLPILMVLDFYSSVNLNQFRNLGVDFIVKPFTPEELKKKIDSLLVKQRRETFTVKGEENELIDKLRPYIKQEVKSEMQNIFKQILEGMEQRHV